MARTRNPRSDEVIQACREQLMIEGGATNWSTVLARFPDVPRATFFRLAEEAKRSIENAAIDSQTPMALREAQRRIRQRVESPETTKRKMKMNLPTAPSPAVVASMPGAAQGQVFDFMAYFHRVVADAEMLRRKAVKVNPDGTEEVLNPHLMDNSIRRRLNIMDTYLQTMDQLYNLEKLQELYRVVVDEVGKADPETQRQILARLRKLNDDRGLTVHAHL